jgi:hypothetical protein
LEISNFTDQLLEGLLGAANDRDVEHQREINTVHDNTSLVTKTPWLRYNRWDKKFVGQDMNELHKLTDPPLPTEVEEKVIWDGVEHILHGCWEGYHDCLTREWDLIPFWLRSVTLDKEDTKPFRSYIAPYTVSRYIGYWQSYILFCWRMYDLQDTRLEFTRTQYQNIIDLRSILNEYTDDQAQELQQALFKLSISFICHSDYAKAPSSLIYYTGVRGYNVDYKQWRQPQDYTTILAGIQFCIRIIMLEHSLPTGTRDEFTEQSIVTPVMKFCQIRQWLIDGGGNAHLTSKLTVDTPFGRIHRTLNYGIAASRDSTTRSRIRWSADSKTLYFDGRALNLKQLVEFIHETLDTAEGIMAKHLLFQGDGDIPEFDLDVVDNPSKRDAGYYFAFRESDAWNKSRVRMVQRIQKAKLEGEWFEYLGDAMEISEVARDNYTKWDEQFREMLALLMMFTCGLSGRGTEMTSLRWMNTMDGDRSIYIEDQQLMFVTEYHKSMALMDDQKVWFQEMELTLDYSKVLTTPH